jgi:murein L,D-transpeptidase YcbB/YkuD
LLYFEGWQGGQKSNLAIVLRFAASLLLLLACVACRNERNGFSLAEQRERQYALNSQKLHESLGQIVSADTDALIADRQLREYYIEGNELIWTRNLLPTDRADGVLRELRKVVGKAGFSERAFHLSQIQEDLDSLRMVSVDSLQPSDIDRLARLEYQLSKAYLRYTMGQSYGFMYNPEHYFNHLDIRDAAYGDNPATYRELMSQEIATPKGDFAKNALEKVLSDKGEDYIQSCKPSSDLYNKLEQKLSETTDKAMRQKVMANMERCRWKTSNNPNKDEKCVLVNIAAQQLWAVSRDTIFNMRVVCGAKKTKTPLMKGILSWIVVNPEWYVPATIVRDEISPNAGDSAYFARHHYFITDSNRDTISPEYVSREDLHSNLYRVTQRRGPGNSLGRLKFNFRNPFDVYLHDTNTHGAFSYSNRALSHGCVRVQRPFDLACFLLNLKDEEEKDRLRTAIGMTPKTEKEKMWLEEHAGDLDRQLNRFGNRSISPTVPVYLIYYTLYPNPADGVLQSWDDPYGYDAQVLKAIKPFL